MPESFLTAVGVRVGYTADGVAVLQFIDDNQATFAVAVLSREQLAAHMGHCADVADALSLGGLALMKPAGKA